MANPAPRRSRRLLLILALVIAVVCGATIMLLRSEFWLPELTQYRGANYEFSYPRVSTLEEYGRTAVAVGREQGMSFVPLVDVVIYREDPQGPVPATYAAFLDQQARNLCGTDGGGESITCTDVVAARVVTSAGYVGQEVSMTLTRQNLETGTTTIGSFGPFYVFDMTPGLPADRAYRYQSLFIYPSLRPFLDGTSDPALVQTIAGSLTSSLIPIEASSTTPATP